MARIVIVNVDDETIRTAAGVLGTSTTSETVDRALAEVVGRREWLELFAEVERGAGLAEEA